MLEEITAFDVRHTVKSNHSIFGGFFVKGVTAHNLVSAYKQFTHFASLDVFHILVNYADFHIVYRLTHTSRNIITLGNRTYACRLGKSVTRRKHAFPARFFHARVESVHKFLAYGVTAHKHVLYARHVVSAKVLAGKQFEYHSRHCKYSGNPVFGNDSHGLFGLEYRLKHHAHIGAKRRMHTYAQSKAVKHGQHHEHCVAL